MIIEQRLVQELEDLLPDGHEKILISEKRKPGKKGTNALLDVDKFAVNTGTPDLAGDNLVRRRS
jgi:hypothetical protein